MSPSNDPRPALPPLSASKVVGGARNGGLVANGGVAKGTDMAPELLSLGRRRSEAALVPPPVAAAATAAAAFAVEAAAAAEAVAVSASRAGRRASRPNLACKAASCCAAATERAANSCESAARCLAIAYPSDADACVWPPKGDNGAPVAKREVCVGCSAWRAGGRGVASATEPAPGSRQPLGRGAPAECPGAHDKGVGCPVAASQFSNDGSGPSGPPAALSACHLSRRRGVEPGRSPNATVASEAAAAAA
mmetsp:Transcript_23143/g.66424  ORF Transcript_23143/g.66424 Transcript_23143/m.66424 type:complete len:250 (-) Transcript_23143:1712-2461(-)